jgi:gliding motility-associated-like protein
VGSDSIVVAAILPLPANFLPADTLLCQYETIELAATGNFSGYTWNTGSVDKVIAAKAPGTYWLQVKDANDCIGRDSISINLKACAAGFYVPTAFTPNNDGKNDLFKPILMGNVLQYKFLIYNRYGELIFESSDFTKGWNGKINGTDQNTNGFTWICWYQLEGSAAKKAKGSVVLLR